MQKSNLKPHILSWLQRDPAAGVKPFVFTPNLEGRARAHQSDLITRACLASTTSDFLLVDRSRKKGLPRHLREVASAIPYRLLMMIVVVCLASPVGETSTGSGRKAFQREKRDLKSVELKSKPAERN